MCVDGNNLYAGFSEVGIAIGSISGNTVTGDWYEMGGERRDTPAVYGTFEWTIAADGNSWDGIYRYADSSNVAGEWSETRLGSSVPTGNQCGFVASSGNLYGGWTHPEYDWNICDEAKNDYTSSYEYDDGTGGYENGISFRSGRILSGAWKDADGSFEGYGFTFRLQNGDAQTWDYYTNWGTDLPEDVDPEEQENNVLSKGSVSVDCNDFQPRGSSNSPGSSSVANVIILSSSLLVLVVLLF